MDVISLSSDSSRSSSPSIRIGQSGGFNNGDLESSLNIESSHSFEILLKNNSSNALNSDNQLLSRIVHSLSDSNESDCDLSGDNDYLQTRLQAKYGHERNKAATSHLNLPSTNKPCTSLGMVS